MLDLKLFVWKCCFIFVVQRCHKSQQSDIASSSPLLARVGARDPESLSWLCETNVSHAMFIVNQPLFFIIAVFECIERLTLGPSNCTCFRLSFAYRTWWTRDKTTYKHWCWNRHSCMWPNFRKGTSSHRIFLTKCYFMQEVN